MRLLEALIGVTSSPCRGSIADPETPWLTGHRP
jgi:hypothetical protein